MRVEQLEPRDNPATLALAGGVLTLQGDVGADVVTVSVSGATYTVSNPAGITLDAGAVAAGWRHSDAATVTGPAGSVDAIDLRGGGGNDTFNVRSTLDPVAIDGEGGADVVNLSSNAPDNSGTLDGILAAVAVVGDGADGLTVSDYSAATGNAASITADTIGGLAPADVTYTGSFVQVRVITSNTPGVAESVTVDSPVSPLVLDTYAGADAVTVFGTTHPLAVNTGYGDDSIVIGAGDLGTILGAVSVNAGHGVNSLTLDDSAGTAGRTVGVTATAVTGLGAAFGFRALGGTLDFGILGGSGADAYTLGAVSSAVRLTVAGNGGDDSFSVVGSVTADLSGGDGVDSFHVAPGKRLRGSIDGGAGDDVYDIQGVVTGGVT